MNHTIGIEVSRHKLCTCWPVNRECRQFCNDRKGVHALAFRAHEAGTAQVSFEARGEYQRLVEASLAERWLSFARVNDRTAAKAGLAAPTHKPLARQRDRRWEQIQHEFCQVFEMIDAIIAADKDLAARAGIVTSAPPSRAREHAQPGSGSCSRIEAIAKVARQGAHPGRPGQCQTGDPLTGRGCNALQSRPQMRLCGSRRRRHRRSNRGLQNQRHRKFRSSHVQPDCDRQRSSAKPPRRIARFKLHAVGRG